MDINDISAFLDTLGKGLIYKDTSVISVKDEVFFLNSSEKVKDTGVGK